MMDSTYENDETSQSVVFDVRICETDASVRSQLAVDCYSLHVFLAHMSLHEAHSPHSIMYKWPYRYVRRFGHSKTQFLFEAGRKCESGEGLFKLTSARARDIFVLVQQNMETLRVPPVPQKTDLSRCTLVLGEKPVPTSNSPLPNHVESRDDSDNPVRHYDSADVFSDVDSKTQSVAVATSSVNGASADDCAAGGVNMSTVIAEMANSKLSDDKCDDSEQVYDQAFCFSEHTRVHTEQATENVYDIASDCKQKK